MNVASIFVVKSWFPGRSLNFVCFYQLWTRLGLSADAPRAQAPLRRPCTAWVFDPIILMDAIVPDQVYKRWGSIRSSLPNSSWQSSASLELPCRLHQCRRKKSSQSGPPKITHGVYVNHGSLTCHWNDPDFAGQCRLVLEYRIGTD